MTMMTTTTNRGLLGLLLLAVLRLAAVHGQGQPPEFDLSMTASCPGKVDIGLRFLVQEGAQVGEDGYDVQAPPVPIDPAHSFFAYINPETAVGDYSNKLTDARPVAFKTAWALAVQIPVGKTGALAWETDAIPLGWRVSLTRVGAETLDLSVASEAPLPAEGAYAFILTAERVGIPVSKSGEFRQIRPGWNLLSPVLLSTRGGGDATAAWGGLREGEGALRVFGMLDGASLPTNGYVIDSPFVIGRAYWVFNPGAETILEWPVTVVEYEGRELTREPGWNFIGVKAPESLAEETAWIWDNDDSEAKSSFRQVVNGAENLEAGAGYWVYQPGVE
jgi:hypothetical protein